MRRFVDGPSRKNFSNYMPVKIPAVKYNTTIFCAKPLTMRPAAATIEPKTVILRHPNFLTKLEAMGPTQSETPI